MGVMVRMQRVRRVMDKMRRNSNHRCTVVSGYLLLAALSIVPVTSQQMAQAQQLRLTNPLNMDRSEVVEIPLHQVSKELPTTTAKLQFLVAMAAMSGKRVPMQLYNDKPGNAPD